MDDIPKIGITGMPSVGKTQTLIKIIEFLENDGYIIEGMITEPIVENDKREPSISFLRNLASEMGIPLGLLFLNVDGDLIEVSPEERALLLRIQDLIFQIQQVKVKNEAADDGKS